jgi:hypothetical protein
MRPVQFEGKCNLPGDWSEGEYDVVPTRWLQEMFALRSALMILSSSSESTNAIDEIRSSHKQTTGESEPTSPAPEESRETGPLDSPESSSEERQDELNCPPELLPYLDQRFTVEEFAYMVHRARGTLDKAKHKSKWDPPDVKDAGTKPAEWTLRKALPGLIQDFPDIRPPKTPGRTA